MPTVVPGIIVSVGSRQSDATTSEVGVATSTPYVSWTLPVGMNQQRFRVNINCLEAGAYAESNTNTRQSTDQFFKYPLNTALTDSFRGVCVIYVEISTQTTGLLEYVSENTYFVYDPEQLLAPASPISIHIKPTPDGIRLTAGTTIQYELQIGTDPTFPSYLYDNPTAFGTSDGGAIDSVGSESFSPSSGTPYFFRTRSYTGGSWQYWTRTQSLNYLGTSIPSLIINDVSMVNNSLGDVRITFTITAGSLDVCVVGFSFTGGSFTLAEPMYLVDPAAKLVTGTHSVTWRTQSVDGIGPNQIGTTSTIVDITGHLISASGIDFSTSYDGFTVGLVPTTQSGGTTTPVDFPLVLGHIGIVPPVQTYKEEGVPLIELFGPAKSDQSTILPVSHGPVAWFNTYIIGTVEQRSQDPFQGYGAFLANGTPLHLYWQGIIAEQNVESGPEWRSIYLNQVDSERQIEITNAAFLFFAPRWDDIPNTRPDPHSSRNYAQMQRFLTGYVDLNGDTQQYPDDYDWTHRPNWHRGREVWGSDDAWIQVAYWGNTNYLACLTCKGKDWVPSDYGPPYDRLPCPNPNCSGGFDHTMPLVKAGGYSTMWKFLDIKWKRLSQWMNCKPYTVPARYGLSVGISPFAALNLHIVGLQPSSLDRKLNGANVPYYEVDSSAGTRIVPGTATDVWDYSQDLAVTGKPSRQPIPMAIPNYEINLTVETNASYEIETVPVVNSMNVSVDLKQNDPVVSHIGLGAQNFFMGQMDPNANPIAWDRPTPNDPGSLALPMILQQPTLTQNFVFRFLSLQATWDSFITLHFTYGSSDTLAVHLQYRVVGDLNDSDWRDILATNGSLDVRSGLWLIPPLTFHAYWDTSVLSQFGDFTSFFIRAQTYDLDSHALSSFIVSQSVEVLHESTNPVSVLSSVYEPWTKTVTVTFRCDSSTGKDYTITNAYYSLVDPRDGTGNVWVPISLSDITGDTNGLSSIRTDNQNIHQLVWAAGNYVLLPADTVRLRLTVVETSSLERITVPFFKWSTPRNPLIDASEQELASILGTYQTQHFDAASQLWVADNPPTRIPGQLLLDQQQYDQVRADPTAAAPSGYYSFFQASPSGLTLVDPAGYQIWLSQSYTVGETHGQAMARISSDMDYLLTVTIPSDQQIILQGEKRIRKNMMEQGYYAEGNFKAGPSGWREVVDAVPLSNRDGSALPATIERWWQFRVQNVAIGGDSLLDANGLFNPTYVTTLEQVYYEIDLDDRQTFDSQSHGSPLRTFLRNDTGDRLSIAQAFGAVAAPIAGNTTITTTQSTPVIDPTTGQAFAGQTAAATSSATTTSVVANTTGILKILPSLLPGQVSTDVLDTGQVDWNGTYYWRVAAYNYLVGLINARPRALVNSMTVSGGDLVVSFTAQAHPDIDTISLTSGIGGIYNTRMVTGYSVSTTAITPFWTDFTQVDFVSDRRAPATDPTRQANPPWVPLGTNRMQPCVFYDADLCQYLIFSTKLNNANSLRIVSARSMCLPSACEWDSIFDSDPSLAIYGPCVIKEAGGYRMFATVQAVSSVPAYIAYSTSSDADTWTDLVQVEGLSLGGNPSVVLNAGVYSMWYQRTSGGRQCVFYATSTDGESFVSQNSDLPVYSDSVDVARPSVVRLNGSWVMYLTDLVANTIISLFSSDGINWTGRTVEMSPTSVTTVVDGTISVTPQNACVFLDRFMGNQELFMMFSYQKSDTTNLTFLSRLEDRVWAAGSAGDAYGDANQFFDAPSSRDGIAHQISINIANNSLPSNPSTGDGVKVRLDFSEFSPTTKEYHRQSDWVTLDTVNEDVGDSMDPSPWYYDTQLLAYPYLRGTDG